MGNYCFDALPGGGKSFGMNQMGFRLVEQRKRDGIVTNQHLNCDELYKYAVKHKMPHLAEIAKKQRVKYETKLDRLLSYRNSVVIFDEAGIFANSRDWKELTKENPNFVIDLCQTRKIGVDLLWSAQSVEMVDKQLRLLTNFYYVCKSAGPIYWRHVFDVFGFNHYKTTGKKNKLRLGFEWGFLDTDIFKIYDSYARLENINNKGLSFDDLDIERAAEQMQMPKSVLASGPASYAVPTNGFFFQPRDGRPPVTAEMDRDLLRRLESYRTRKVSRKAKVTGILWLPEEVLERAGV